MLVVVETLLNVFFVLVLLVVAAIIAVFVAIIRWIAGTSHRYDRPQPLFPSHRWRGANEPPSLESVNQVAQSYGLIPDAYGWCGWSLVARDAGGEDNITRKVAATVDVADLKARRYIRGNPGSGLETSSFGVNQIVAGERGENLLAAAVMAGETRVISWWSLYGFDEYGQLSNSDIDCVLVGMKPDGRPVAWFVDAKAYKGGADTMYVNLDAWRLARISKTYRAFVAGANGQPWLTMSPNMWEQRERWTPLLNRMGVEAYWIVCVMAPGSQGTPDMSRAVWPGNVTTMDVPSLYHMIESMCVPSMVNMVPPELVALLDSHLKTM